MNCAEKITPRMEVVDRNSRLLGIVERVEAGYIRLASDRRVVARGVRHIPLAWVNDVDAGVGIDRDADAIAAPADRP